ncbi:MAG: hypothetical protein JJU12_03795 [Chlamydiales bacterium]|nr:hypothetical protein [Chlamydiales bacterium]
MTLKEIAQMFNRSISHSFGLKKSICLFAILFFSGLIILFFQGVAVYASPWLKLPFRFIPLFIAIGLIMAGGIFSIRLYEKELEGENPSLSKVARHSWDLLIKATYLALPLLAAFLIFWVLIGVFILLKAIPYIGPFFGVFLASAPFLLSFGILLLFLVALAAFFFITPSLAKREKLDRVGLLMRLRSDFFLNLLLLGVAYLPVWILWLFVKNAAQMTLHFYSYGDGRIEILLQGIFVLLPLAAIVTPGAAFFFNFAYESYLALGGEDS